MAVIVVPSPEAQLAMFEQYALALGKVAHAWNMLFERLGRLFTVVTQMHQPAAAAVWNAPDSDRIKVEMLKASVSNFANKQWSADFPKAREDMLWLLDRVSHLTDLRNNAIHAPCSLVITGSGSSIRADSMTGHSRAKKLSDKEILVEFDWCERWSDLLSHFADDAREALLYRDYGDGPSPWPDRPAKPDRLRQKDLPTMLLRALPKEPNPPPLASQE